GVETGGEPLRLGARSLGAAVDGDRGGDVRVLAQPAPGVGTPGDDCELLVGGPSDGGAYQLAARPLSAKRVGDFRVQQEQTPVLDVVDEFTLGTVLLQHATVLGAAVADRRRLFGSAHARMQRCGTSVPSGQRSRSHARGLTRRVARRVDQDSAGPSGDRTRTSPRRSTETGPSELTAMTVAAGAAKLERRPEGGRGRRRG